jgi:zinc/manganese transport system substrate-binding protein
MKRISLLIVLLLSLLSVGALSAQDAPLRVIASTTILADVAQNVAGDLFTVSALVPADADTHAFEPAPADVALVADADLLLVVGMGYETFLGDLLENAGTDEASVVVASNGVEILGSSEGAHAGEEELAMMSGAAAETGDEHDHEHGSAEVVGVLGQGELECDVDEHEGEAEADAHEDEHARSACDPHVWMDPHNVEQWAMNIAAAFGAADPANAAVYTANAEAYAAQLEALDEEVIGILAGIPEEGRVLVTNHEFMAYFAAHYGFEVVGTVLPSVSTDAEPDPQALADLIAEVQEEGVTAIFAEVSANPQLAEVVAQEAGITVVTSLYSESLSGVDGPAATYIDYLRHNAQAIADALAG